MLQEQIELTDEKPPFELSKNLGSGVDSELTIHQSEANAERQQAVEEDKTTTKILTMRGRKS